MKNFYYRFLFIVTLFTGCLFICTMHNSFSYVLVLGTVFGILFGISYFTFSNMSKEYIDELLMVKVFEKYGINFDED